MKTNFFQNTLIVTAVFTLAACQIGSVEQNKAAQLATPGSTESTKASTQLVEKTEVKVDTIFGFDVSHFQGEVDWATIKESGKHFGIAKSTQGMTYTDPRFAENWNALEENGMYRGTYHFYVAKDDPIKQAEHFVATVKNMGTHHLPPALDLEGESIDGLAIETYQENVLKWLDYVEKKMGIKPMIYTNHPFGNEYLNNEKFSNYHLWIAEYGSKAAKIPEAWKGKSWTGWQFTQSDKTAGVNGSVDESKFLSTILLTSK